MKEIIRDDAPVAALEPLAGVCTFEEAARVGYGVEETVGRLVRYAWLEKRAMELGLRWLNPTPEWEVKEALSLHLYLDSEHVAAIRRRVGEMRNPPPRMDVSPDPSLEHFGDQLLAARDTLERVVGLYGVLRPALLRAYREHRDRLNPLVDWPTRRLLGSLILDEEEAVAWGAGAIRALTQEQGAAERAKTWRSHLEACLRHAGGVAGDADPPDEPPPSPRPRADASRDFFPRRDARFEQADNFVFPPHEVARQPGVPADERTLALMCKRCLEMDVPEAMARMVAEAEGQPWEYYTDMCRQLWDEARHAMMGSAYLESLGIDWKREVPLHPGFAIRLNRHLSAREAHAVLYMIEQSLMPADTGKRYEWQTAGEAGDALARLYQDYDWADEVLHARIGRRWLVEAASLTRDEVIELGRQKALESEGVLDRYAEPDRQVDWWPGFVRRVLGRDSAAATTPGSTSDPVYRNLSG